MQKFLYIFLSLIFLSGCATTKEHSSKDPTYMQAKISQDQLQAIEEFNPKEKLSDSQENEEGVDLDLPALPLKGIVFGKTDFQGVLQQSYVDLLIEDVKNSEKKYTLHIGGEAVKKTLLGEVKTVEPGYFFIELPEGEYKIVTVAIPVGTIEATELINISFKVLPETIVYIGTLNIIGTKERIKLGGLPVIKPGFEYNVQIFDEQKDALSSFHERFPHVNNSKEIIVKLMKDNTAVEGVNQE